MLREIGMTVIAGERPVFRFDEPLSIIMLSVATSDDTILWEILPGDSEPVEVINGSFQSWPIAEAPPEILAMFEKVERDAEIELAQHGPRSPALSEVRYGVAPDGYRERVAAQTLAPGEYGVLVFGEQGTAGARFVID